jgi:nicotinate-nucleotide adenylyltransferase
VFDSGNDAATRREQAPAGGRGAATGGSGDRTQHRLGILGGTFNPPHLARLSPHKNAAEDPGSTQRLGMCRLLVADEEGLQVSALELDRDGPSYTVDTLRALHAAHPATPLTLILGADVARTLPAWREPRELLALAELAIALRAGSTAEQVEVELASLLDQAALEQRVRFLRMPALEISSSLVRARAARGEPVGELVGDAVAGYIATHELYRTPQQVLPAR